MTLDLVLAALEPAIDGGCYAEKSPRTGSEPASHECSGEE
jgi:hypothetical protein